jgi:hypothetical protein
MCISLDLENKDSMIKSSRDKESTFSKCYKEKFGENKKINTSSSINTEKETIDSTSTLSTEPNATPSATTARTSGLQLNCKEKLVIKHKFSNSAVTQKSPKKHNINEPVNKILIAKQRKMDGWRL